MTDPTPADLTAADPTADSATGTAPSPERFFCESCAAEFSSADALRNHHEPDDEPDETDGDYFEECEPNHERTSCIRAKWTMDGAATLAEAAERLDGFASYLRSLATEGWVLTSPVSDDYGFLVLPPEFPVPSKR